MLDTVFWLSFTVIAMQAHSFTWGIWIIFVTISQSMLKWIDFYQISHYSLQHFSISLLKYFSWILYLLWWRFPYINVFTFLYLAKKQKCLWSNKATGNIITCQSQTGSKLWSIDRWEEASTWLHSPSRRAWLDFNLY